MNAFIFATLEGYKNDVWLYKGFVMCSLKFCQSVNMLVYARQFSIIHLAPFALNQKLATLVKSYN